MTTEPYTPTVEELAKNTTIRDRRVVALTREERTRGIAKVQADALRDALEDLDGAGLDTYAANEFGTWLGHRADRIEEEA